MAEPEVITPEPTTIAGAGSDVTKQFTQTDLDAAVAKASDGIRTELLKERNSRQDFSKKFEESQAALKTIQDNIETEKAKKEKEGLESAGQYQEALEKAKAEHDTKLAEAKAETEQQDVYIRKLLVDNAIMAAAGDAYNPQEIVTLMTSMNMFKVIKKDGDYTVEALDETGVPLFNDEAKAASVEFAVNKFLSTRPHLVKAKIQSGTGSDVSKDGAGGDQKIQSLQKQYDDLMKSDKPGKTAMLVALSRQIQEANQ